MSGEKRENVKEGTIEKELAGATAAGKAPQFEIQSFDLHNCLWIMGREGKKRGEKRLRATISILLDGYPIVHVKEQTVKQSRRGCAYEGRMGSVDIMETVLREAIALRWPEIEPALEKIKTASYAVHAIGALNNESHEHHVQVHLRVIIDGCDKPYAVSREGVDSIGLTFEALTTIYHWFVWRTLRRIRGEKRPNRVRVKEGRTDV